MRFVTQQRRAWLVTAALALCLLAPASARATDPFYDGLLRSGREALANEDAVTAVHRLKIACFGFLEQPTELAECLVHLALAHDALQETDGFRMAFDRVAELDQRFTSYQEAELDEATREAFEGAVVRHISERRLANSPFRPLLLAKFEAEIAAMPPRQRRAQLAVKVTEEPDNPRWLVQLAWLEVEDGKGAEALGWANQARELGVDLPCIRGYANSELKQDEEALGEFRDCPELTKRAELAVAALRSWTRLERWDEAAAFLEQATPEVQADSSVARLARRVERKSGVDVDEATELVAQTDPEPEPEPGAETPDGREEPVSARGLSETETADLQQAREILRTARRADELRDAAALAEPVAAAHPDSQEAQLLAGEIAYRAARWDEASSFFRAGGDPGDDRPALLFYMAVAFYESGDPEAAREALARCLPKLHRTPYVDRYIDRIQGTD